MRKTIAGLVCLIVTWNVGTSVQAQGLDSEVQTLVKGNNDFALAIYQHVAAADGNRFFSPYSISNALAMTYAGAAAIPPWK